MNEKENNPWWLSKGLMVATAIIIFRLVSAVLEIIHFQIRRIPYDFVGHLGFFSSFLTPIIAITCAVLISRWPERKMEGARRKTKIGILIILAVLALLPLEFKQKFVLQPCPQAKSVGDGGGRR